MSLPTDISDRDLIESLFARVEMLEGALRAYRVLVPALAGSLNSQQLTQAMETAALLKGDALTSLDLQQGQTLRGLDVHRANQLTGFQVEWRQLADLLQEHASGR